MSLLVGSPVMIPAGAVVSGNPSVAPGPGASGAPATPSAPLGGVHLDNLAAIAAVAYGVLRGPRWVAYVGGAYLLYSQRGTIATLLGQTPSTAQQVAALQHDS